MIEFLDKVDTSLFLFLNNLHAPWLDTVMLSVSYNKYLFLGIIFFVSIYGVKYFKKWYLIAFLLCLVSFGLSDRISSGLFKPYFERLRPCHNPTLANQVHLAGQNCWGGKFGFVSSHASNSFAIAMFFWLLFRKKNRWFFLMFVYAGLVSYSRIYLAKHYPGDILFGALLGLATGYAGYKLFTLLRQRFADQQ